VCVESTLCVENYTLRVWTNLGACLNHTRECSNYTLRVEITLCECKTYSRVCTKHTLRGKSHSAYEITLVRVEIILCVWKLHSACINHFRKWRNHTRKCRNHTHVCVNHNLLVQSHSANGNCTLRVEITLVRVKITLVRVVMADLFFLSWEGGNYCIISSFLVWFIAENVISTYFKKIYFYFLIFKFFVEKWGYPNFKIFNVKSFGTIKNLLK
jgi:hypothetical protein